MKRGSSGLCLMCPVPAVEHGRLLRIQQIAEPQVPRFIRMWLKVDVLKGVESQETVEGHPSESTIRTRNPVNISTSSVCDHSTARVAASLAPRIGPGRTR
jgi:hypothetical protein